MESSPETSVRPGFGFASDNAAGAHPRVLQDLLRIGSTYDKAYGDDPITKRAQTALKKLLGEDAHIHFVFNGTGANVLGLTTLLRSYQSVIATQASHVHVDECGALENFSGNKIINLTGNNGKIGVGAELKRVLKDLGNVHHTQPRILSIAQSTELGTVYTVEELRSLCDFAHANGLLVHMDGARLANAAAHLNLPLKNFTKDVGIDVLTVGATKNGALFGEAVVFWNPDRSDTFRFYQKQGLQLASKHRFLSQQFVTLFEGELWLENARHANSMAQKLATGLKVKTGAKITQKVQGNAVFALLPRDALQRLQQEFHFYTWDEGRGECRLMTSFATQATDVERLVDAVARECPTP